MLVDHELFAYHIFAAIEDFRLLGYFPLTTQGLIFFEEAAMPRPKTEGVLPTLDVGQQLPHRLDMNLEFFVLQRLIHPCYEMSLHSCIGLIFTVRPHVGLRNAAVMGLLEQIAMVYFAVKKEQ